MNKIPMPHSYSTGTLQEIQQNLRDPRGRSIFTHKTQTITVDEVVRAKVK